MVVLEAGEKWMEKSYFTPVSGLEVILAERHAHGGSPRMRCAPTGGTKGRWAIALTYVS